MIGIAAETAKGLLDYCATDQQRLALTKIAEGLTYRATSDVLGVDRSRVSKIVKAVRLRAARSGYAPEHDMTRQVPDGFVAKGVSTYYDKEGNPTGQWVKAQIDLDRQRDIQQAAFDALAEDLPRLPAVDEPTGVSEQLCNLFVLSDVHLGMLSWERETGGTWDLDEGQRVVSGAWREAVRRSPKAGKAVISILGDFFHSDGLQPVTPTSGHILDQDSRFPKIAEAGVRLLRRIVSEALETHGTVHLCIAEGNHDIISSMWLRTMFGALYENEPRLTVDDSVLPYYAYEHGEVMLGFHHGHIKGVRGAGADKLALLFANRQEWQGKRFRYIHTGHFHHTATAEVPGAVLHQHATLAAPDAHAARGGYDSSRLMTATTYHAEHGEVSRLTINPDMI
jgi:hypothetical protein